LGAVPVVADALDPDQVAESVGRAQPGVIVHQLTAIPPSLDMRHFDRDFEASRVDRPHASIRQCPLSRLYKNGGLQAWLPLSNHIATLSGLTVTPQP
jgi:hypothetical protein